ncbi:UNVERIFIED_CONTAM: hypothetical protein HDU68_009752 [Siphonaria sp. JEL0065]|nr:hypothetical protein HDU68_009752 [Siphonaria sp. JEL0065]
MQVSPDSPFFQALGSLIQASIASALDERLSALSDRISKLEQAVLSSTTTVIQEVKNREPVFDQVSLETRLLAIEKSLEAVTADREDETEMAAAIASAFNGVSKTVGDLAENVKEVKELQIQNTEKADELYKVLDSKLDGLKDIHGLAMQVGQLTNGLSNLESRISSQIDTCGPIVEKAMDEALQRYDEVVEKKKIITTITSSLSALPSSLGFGSSQSSPTSEQPSPPAPPQNRTILSRFRKATSFPGAKPAPSVTATLVRIEE